MCEEGQVLSYSIHDLSLEPPIMCNEQQTCVDWLGIEVPGYGDTEIMCGTQNNDNTFYLDGQTSMSIEFVTNRDSEAAGFLLFTTCSDPGFTRPRPEEETEGNETRKRAVSEECTFPPSMSQTPPLQSLLSRRWPVALFQQQISPRRPMTLVSNPDHSRSINRCMYLHFCGCFVQEEEVEALLRRNNTISRVVAMGDLVGYNFSVVTLYRNQQFNENFRETFRGIAVLRLINRISRRQFSGVAPQNYTGFGELFEGL